MKIAVCGYGVVGKGVVDIIDRRDDCEVLYIFTRETLDDKRYTTDYQDILNDKHVDLVVEAMGGIEPAFSMLKAALEQGKHVVTSNKALVAKHGATLHLCAQKHGVHFLFEGSVGGGIPILSALRNGLAHEPIYKIEAILNGTSNYILTQVIETDASFETVLKRAQRLGYAERDPSDDVDGFDTARKIAILGSILTKHFVDYESIYTVGIRHVHPAIYEFAKKMDFKLKLVACLETTEAGVTASVEPILLPKKHPLYQVDDVDNAVAVYGKDVGTIVFKGQGAGREPTASAVVADVLACKNPYLVNTTWDFEPVDVKRDKGMYAVWLPVEAEIKPFCNTEISVVIMDYNEAQASGGVFVRIEGEL